MLSVAAFDSGLHAQASPTFGSERNNAVIKTDDPTAPSVIDLD